MTKSPFLLCILDGVGLHENKYANALHLAKTPTLDKLFKHCPNATLRTDGPFVGLPEGQFGNSEVGHTTIGAGRIIPQMLDKLNIDSQNSTLEKKLSEQNFSSARAIHLLGMISDGGVHSHTNHILAALEYLNTLNKPVFLHIITDGRDTAPHCAQEQLSPLLEKLPQWQNVHPATLSGRYYAMDRDQRWERTEKTYNAMVNAEAPLCTSIEDALQKANHANETDEFITPRLISCPAGLDPRVQHQDAFVAMNFRADRMRQIIRCFINDPTLPLKTGHMHKLKPLITLTEYGDQFKTDCTPLYTKEPIENTLAEIISFEGLSQLHIAETEKYPHVTYFLNGGRETEFEGEARLLINSPKVATYDLQPEMSLPEVTEQLLSFWSNHLPALTVLNMANGDMVGHTGDLNAAIKAVEALDTALTKLLAFLEDVNGQAIIIADHGNCEEMLTANNTPHTSHTTNPVPIIYFGKQKGTLTSGGLADVAPTVLALMGLPQPANMTGKCLFTFA